MRLCELKEKEVVNICDGQCLGNVCDIEFDLCNGCVTAVIIPGPCKMFGMFGREEEYVIPSKCVKKIGEDVILVDIEIAKCVKKCEWR
ncbi:MAG: YlmC/YmxH family sporulation protein [Lachnospiraceae bacterium]|nr:YlmC/YmxH family sporulation protein [Lachnospiraceae bacterium]